MQIDLIWIGEHGQNAPRWEPGKTIVVKPQAAALADLIAAGAAETPDLVLFWDAMLGAPDAEQVKRIGRRPGDVWHAGLRLGMGAKPQFLDYVNPVWRFNRDAPSAEGTPADIATASWRLSLRACLVRGEILRQLGGPDGSFATLEGMALELGYRWVRRGALMRHVPQLLDGRMPQMPCVAPLPLPDEFRFVHKTHGPKWALWALWRALANGAALPAAVGAYLATRREQASIARKPSPKPLQRDGAVGQDTVRDQCFTRTAAQPSVTVLIPTLDRYPFLLVLLDQLRRQTVPPLEIIVVDQTEPARRQTEWPQQFTDLPLRVLYRDQAGQCSSRNAGLQVARGDTILFLDDDDEIPPDLIACHLAFLECYQADASCGVAEEVGAGELPVDFTFVRDSDVFPTNNSLLRREALCASGLFDLAYEKGERADKDLGMRLYLTGHFLILNPAASVVHLHAPRGGLRQHKARVITRASSRASVLQRQLLSPTEAYLWRRYFSPRQVSEAVLLFSFSSLGGAGRGMRRLLRLLMMGLLLPDTLRRNRRSLKQAELLSAAYPVIPQLDYSPNRDEPAR